MENLHVNLEQVTKYLIRLYYRTGKKYTCSWDKIGKLLSILALSYAHEGKKLFEEEIRKVNGIGLTIHILSFLENTNPLSPYLCAYYIYNDEDDKQPISDIPLFDCYIPEKYRCPNPPKDICSRIEEVFKKFGSYSRFDLINLTNKMELGDVLNKDKSIMIEKISGLHLSDFKETNEIIEYIFSERNEKSDCI